MDLHLDTHRHADVRPGRAAAANSLARGMNADDEQLPTKDSATPIKIPVILAPPQRRPHVREDAKATQARQFYETWLMSGAPH